MMYSDELVHSAALARHARLQIASQHLRLLSLLSSARLELRIFELRIFELPFLCLAEPSAIAAAAAASSSSIGPSETFEATEAFEATLAFDSDRLDLERERDDARDLLGALSSSGSTRSGM